MSIEEGADIAAQERRDEIDMKRTTLCNRFFKKEIINESPLIALTQHKENEDKRARKLE